MQLSFYHLTKTALEEAIPKLMEKLLESGGRAVINFSSDDMMQNIDKKLWSVGGTRFIPHATDAEDFQEDHPIILSKNYEAQNNPNFLVLTQPISVNEETLNNFERCLILFNGKSENELSVARSLWKKFSENQNYTLKYFLQNEKGVWQEKN